MKNRGKKVVKLTGTRIRNPSWTSTLEALQHLELLLAVFDFGSVRTLKRLDKFIRTRTAFSSEIKINKNNEQTGLKCEVHI